MLRNTLLMDGLVIIIANWHVLILLIDYKSRFSRLQSLAFVTKNLTNLARTTGLRKLFNIVWQM